MWLVWCVVDYVVSMFLCDKTCEYCVLTWPDMWLLCSHGLGCACCILI